MSDKPVYQSQTGGEWHDVTDKEYAFRKELSGVYKTRILYPAAAYEALQKENEAQAKRIAELEDRLSSFPIPTSVAMQKIGKFRSEGFKEYAATVLNKENQYCIVGDYGDVRWIYQRMEIVNDTRKNKR